MSVGDWVCVVVTGLVLMFVAIGAAVAVWIKSAAAARRAEELGWSMHRMDTRVSALEAERRRPESNAPARSPAPPRLAPTVPLPRMPETAATIPIVPDPDAPPPLPRPIRMQAEARPAQPPPLSLESFIGGRVLLVIGVVSVLFGLGFFLKYAIDNEWITPAGRIALGVAAGIAAIVAGDRLRARGYDVYGQSLMGGGVGALYICDFFASVRYELWDRPAAFAIALAVTAGAVITAVRRRAAPLAWLGFAGAYMAPGILGRNEDAIEGLTVWLVIIHAGVGATLLLRPWILLDVAVAVASVVYFTGWRMQHFTEARIGAAGTCMTALVLVSVTVAIAPAVIARRRAQPGAVIAVAGVLFFGYVAGLDLFYPEHRGALGLALFLAAFLVAGAGQLVRARVADGREDAEAWFGIGLATAIAAVPVLLRGHAVAPAWAAFGAACFHAGIVRRDRITQAAGIAAIVLSAGDVLVDVLPLRGDAPLALNGPFLAALSPCAAVYVAAWSVGREDASKRSVSALLHGIASTMCTLLSMHEAARAAVIGVAPEFVVRHAVSGATAAAALIAAAYTVGAFLRTRLQGDGRARAAPVIGPMALTAVCALVAACFLTSSPLETFPGPLFQSSLLAIAVLFGAAALGVLRPPALAAAIAVLFLLVTFQIHVWGQTSGEPRRAQVWTSVAWALYASALVAWGFTGKVAALRWAGISVFLLTIGKVFLVDLASLETVYRVGSFLGLGVLLVAASFLYQRLRRSAGEPPPP